MGASPCAAVLGLGSIPARRLLHLPGYLGPLTTPPRVCFNIPALNRSQDLSLCADGTARRGQSPLRCWGSEPPVPSAARLPRPASPPEAAGKRRDSLTVHESVFRKRGGKKGRRNKSTVERQLVNAESSRREGLTELGTGSPPVPIPALVDFSPCRGWGRHGANIQAARRPESGRGAPLLPG